jgi:apolipoprotein N-acyltransferase
VFPQLFRSFVKTGADFMINLTNEGWFGESAAPYQFLSMSVFRAVENRRALARAANTGISGFIDPYGRITGRVWNNNKDIYVEGYLTRAISVSQEQTFYTIYGDVFVYLNIVIALLITGLSFFRKEKK